MKNSHHYTALINTIFEVVNDINPFLDTLDEQYRPYLLEDFTKVMLLAAKGEEFTKLHKFAFSLLATQIVGSNAGLLQDANELPIEQVVELFIKTYDGQKSFFDKMNSQNYNFSLNSFVLFKDDELDSFKKTLYEFAELITKADGTVTENEIANLKNISKNYLSLQKTAAPATDGADDSGDKDGKAPARSLDTILSDINNMVGMDTVKQDIQSLINIIKANKMRAEQGLPQLKSSLHTVFMGAPGTGKTTIARMLAEIYSSLGILSQNNLVETDRSGMVAGYVGQTAIKADAIIKKAVNGVLFIDEAYTLSRGDESDFGQEAIDTLLKRMEDNRETLVVIVAGYEGEMNDFINSNPGLQSRFNRYFYFNDYTPDELTEIYSRMANKAGFALTAEANTRLTELFKALYDKRGKQFGNARLARNIFEKSFEKHANRTASIAPITREILTTMEEADIPFNEFSGIRNPVKG